MEDFEKPFDVYKTLYNQFNQYLGHDTNIVDSIESTDKVGVQPGAVYEATSYEKQKNAEQFLARNVLPRITRLKSKCQHLVIHREKSG